MARSRSQRARARAQADVPLDAIDKYHESDSDGASESSSLDSDAAAETVFDVQGASDSDESDSDDSSLGLPAAPDVDSDSASDDASDDDATKANWGRKKKSYYDGDEGVMGSDSEAEREAEEEEAAEVRRLRKARLAEMGEDDFDLGLAEDESDEAAGKKGGKKSRRRRSTADSDGAVEYVEKAVHKLSTKEKLKRIEREAPELIELLNDLTARVREVREKLVPLMDRVASGELATDKGISYLEVKYHLLTSYCTNVAFYLLAKAGGVDVKEHPVIWQLVELRTMMEKLKPLDSKLKYQLDKLLRLAVADESDAAAMRDGSALAMRANPNALVSRDADEKGGVRRRAAAAAAPESDDDDAGDMDDVYRAPKINAVRYEEDDKESRKRQKEKEKLRDRLKKSRTVQELRAEYGDAPEEVRPFKVDEVDDSVQEKRDEVQQFEEDNFLRLSLSKREQKKMARPSAKKRRIDMFADFDDFADLADPADRRPDADDPTVVIAKARQKYEDEQRAKRKRRGGDEDLPYKGDRRTLSVRDDGRAMADDDHFGGHDTGAAERVRGEEDPMYREAAERSARRRADKKELARAASQVFMGDDDDVNEGDGKRAASRQMLKNRGLTSDRKKINRNPRAKKRMQFDKAVIKRKSQGAQFDPAARMKPYSGEATGIRSHVTKSVKYR